MMSKWPLALMSMGGALGILTIVWIAWGGIGYPTTTHAISFERKETGRSHGAGDPQVTEANIHFIERARAIEAGFKAAFPFHK